MVGTVLGMCQNMGYRKTSTVILRYVKDSKSGETYCVKVVLWEVN